jgi:hypothetical protein
MMPSSSITLRISPKVSPIFQLLSSIDNVRTYAGIQGHAENTACVCTRRACEVRATSKVIEAQIHGRTMACQVLQTRLQFIRTAWLRLCRVRFFKISESISKGSATIGLITVPDWRRSWWQEEKVVIPELSRSSFALFLLFYFISRNSGKSYFSDNASNTI